VQIGTVLFRNPNCVVEMLEGLESYCNEMGIGELRSLTGALKI